MALIPISFQYEISPLKFQDFCKRTICLHMDKYLWYPMLPTQLLERSLTHGFSGSAYHLGSPQIKEDRFFYLKISRSSNGKTLRRKVVRDYIQEAITCEVENLKTSTFFCNKALRILYLLLHQRLAIVVYALKISHRLRFLPMKWRTFFKERCFKSLPCNFTSWKKFKNLWAFRVTQLLASLFA